MQELGIITRQQTQFFGNRKRVLGHFFLPGDEQRCRKIVKRVLAQSPDEISKALDELFASFEQRHRQLDVILQSNFDRIAHLVDNAGELTREQQLLIGGYFTSEYSIEAAALFNPSMAPHPDQSGVPQGQTRYILSLRATGEGHISSLAFSTGIVAENGDIMPDDMSPFATGPASIRAQGAEAEIEFGDNTRPAERVIFPVTPDECNGIEDVRLVPFVDKAGETTWYGTYTAYDGHRIQSKLLQTRDFKVFRTHTLQGKAAQNKGMALFPRKINGRYAMISRQDGENLFIMFSDNLLRWDKAELLQEPQQPWEFVQLGNCGSPIETDEGWLLLSHSVGAMRTYVISAYLLDRKNPAKIIGRLPGPLIAPNESERDGYVPNVVYSCGAMKHGDQLVIPYAMSDYACGFCNVAIPDLMNHFI